MADDDDETDVLATALAAIKALPAPTCAKVEQRVGWLWDERSAIDDFDDVDAFDTATNDFAQRFHSVLPQVWELSTCNGTERMARFTEDPDTSEPVFCTDTHVLEFDDAHRLDRTRPVASAATKG